MVFGCSSDQGNSPNIDLLYSFRDCDVDLRDCILEGVEVADHVVDFVDILLGEVFLIGCEVACEDTGMNLCNNQRPISIGVRHGSLQQGGES